VLRVRHHGPAASRDRGRGLRGLQGPLPAAVDLVREGAVRRLHDQFLNQGHHPMLGYSGIGRWGGMALVLALGLARSAFAAGFVTQSFPVPVAVEKERVRTSMRLQLDVQRYGLPFETFAGGQLDAAEVAFREFMTALRAGDVARTAALRPGDAPD